jgi:hypothetical protein
LLFGACKQIQYTEETVYTPSPSCIEKLQLKQGLEEEEHKETPLPERTE